MKCKWKILVFFAIMLFSQNVIIAQISEDQIKSVYIEKFTRFVEWPDSIEIADTSKPFIFGFLGNSKIYETLKEMYRNKTIRNKKVVFIHFNSTTDIKDCHLVFISSSKQKSLSQIILGLQKFPILLIGDTKGFAEKGVHINFYVIENNILFEINPDAVKSSSLYMNHHLMRAAKIVRSGTSKK
ncbi:MAG: YfiR family protein [Calditrichia bacterium]|nr:YfiR family protein [Calditrichia bacterium]